MASARERICEIAGRRVAVHETREDTPPDLAEIERILKADAAITHVFAVHCETTSGILNPIAEIGALVEKHGRRFLIDAMSAFGALPLDAKATRFDALAASSNKCIEGVPGLGFVIAARRRWPRPRATPPRWCSTCTTSGRTWPRPGSTASRRRST